MSDCAHSKIGSEIKIRQEDGRRWAEVRLVCADCREPFRFSGVRPGMHTDWPTTTVDGQTVRLPIEPATGTPSRLRCHECARFLFGRPRYDDGTELHRSVGVVAIECGPVHVVRYRDGEAVAVGDGLFWRLEEGNDGEV